MRCEVGEGRGILGGAEISGESCLMSFCPRKLYVMNDSRTVQIASSC